MEDGARLLVVDDERAITELLEGHLTERGYQVSHAAEAEGALRRLSKNGVDLLITDIRMPGLSGLDLLEDVKKNDPDLPVIVLTSVSEVGTAVRAMRAGAHDYITKPFNLDQLEISVERAIEKRNLVLENRRIHEELELKVEEKTRKLRLALTEVQGTFNATIESMVSAIEARDCETQHHCHRAREYCLLLAQRLGITGKALRDLAWGSLLHDVGKIGVPDGILLKPGSLTTEEWALMRKHPIIGYRMLAPIRFLRGAAQIVLHHHEKWDGTGYPYGKQGEEIPVGARIFMVADAYETITSKRSYKEPQPYEVAREEIVECAGTHFDPQVVEQFLRIPWENFELIRGKYLAEIEGARAATGVVDPAKILAARSAR